ncbi:MAG: 1-phosphofructokinase family hexose kinase [Chloroflexi bacterium]|nr:MAG: 1-phosphofructokinase family hexose kinase [Chloroflexota bacterium]
MIVTVTLNPALDQTVEVEGFAISDTNRVCAPLRLDISGKGINVARGVKALGFDALACGLAPGQRGRLIEQQLIDSGIECDFVHVSGETRTNITVLDRSTHTSTQLLLPGPQLEPAAIDELHQRLRAHLTPGSWVVLAGSIPPPGDPAIYAGLIRMATEMAAFTALDADGPVVEVVLASGAYPTLLKMNEYELSRLCHTEIDDEQAALKAARKLQGTGIANVVITLGGEGAVAVTTDGEYLVRPPQITVESAVGAGDGFTSGLVCGLVRDGAWEPALTLAAATGSATCLAQGNVLRTRADVEELRPQVRVSRLPE